MKAELPNVHQDLSVIGLLGTARQDRLYQWLTWVLATLKLGVFLIWKMTKWWIVAGCAQIIARAKSVVCFVHFVRVTLMLLPCENNLMTLNSCTAIPDSSCVWIQCLPLTQPLGVQWRCLMQGPTWVIPLLCFYDFALQRRAGSPTRKNSYSITYASVCYGIIQHHVFFQYSI